MIFSFTIQILTLICLHLAGQEDVGGKPTDIVFMPIFDVIWVFPMENKRFLPRIVLQTAPLECFSLINRFEKAGNKKNETWAITMLKADKETEINTNAFLFVKIVGHCIVFYIGFCNSLLNTIATIVNTPIHFDFFWQCWILFSTCFTSSLIFVGFSGYFFYFFRLSLQGTWNCVCRNCFIKNIFELIWSQ